MHFAVRFPWLAAGLGAMALSLGGCSVWDEFVVPETPSPPHWAASVEGAKAAWPSDDWWTGFHSPQLDRLMADARRANFDLAAAVARVRQADAQLRIAGAALLPAVGATAGADRDRLAFGPSNPSYGSDHAPVYLGQYGLGLAVSYQLDFWGRNRALAEAAGYAARQSRFDARTTQLAVQVAVATTYFDMVGQSQRLAVARQTVANAQSVLDAYRARLEVGTATALDVAQQESVVATQRAAVAPLEQQIRQDANALAALTGRLPEDAVVTPEDFATLALPVVQPGLPAQLLARRPDVQSAEAALAAANADIGAARAQFFPNIQLTGTGGVQSAMLSTLLQHTALVYDFGTSLTQPLFEGGALEGQLEQAKGRYDELDQAYRKAVVSAFRDVENALVAVRQSDEEDGAQRAAERTARTAFEIARSQLAGGTVDVTTVLNTQRVLYSAQDAAAQARLAHLQAVVGLYGALGGGWDGSPTYPGEEKGKS